MGVFLVWIALSVVLFSTSAATVQKLITKSEMLLLIATLALVAQAHDAMWGASRAALIVAVAGTVINVSEFILPGVFSFSSVPERAAGLYTNPNISSLYLNCAMVVAVFAIPLLWRSAFCIFIGLGVVVTFSRSGILTWGVAMLGLAWWRVLGHSRSRQVLMVTGLVGVSAFTLAAGEWVRAFESLGFEQQLTANTTGRISGLFFQQADDSAVERLEVAEHGWEMFSEAPWFGQGFAATSDWDLGASTHNMYAMFGAELGIGGIVLLLALVGVLWRTDTALGRVIALLFAFSSLFTHNNLDQPAMAIVLALAVGTAYEPMKVGGSPIDKAGGYS
jgi:O-antigen ligase